MRQIGDFVSLAMAETAERLGERLRIARRARGLSLEMLADRTRVHRTTLGRLERGDTRVSIDVLLRVLEALGVLSDIELLISRPEAVDQRAASPKVPDLPTEF